MSDDPDYGECYSCGCEGMAMTFRQFANLKPLELEAVIPVFTFYDGTVICGECYYERRTAWLAAAQAMVAWEQEQMQETKTQEYFQ